LGVRHKLAVSRPANPITSCDGYSIAFVTVTRQILILMAAGMRALHLDTFVDGGFGTREEEPGVVVSQWSQRLADTGFP